MLNKLKKYTAMSDMELTQKICRAGKNSEKAFYVFYHRYNITVFSYFLASLHNRQDAEDLHQTTFEKFYTRLRSGFLPDNPGGYLMRIARNALINMEIGKYYCKDNKTLKHEYIEDIDEITEILADNPVEEIEVSDLLELINWAITLIGDKYSGPFIDRNYNEMPVKNIAEKYNLSFAATKKRISRAKVKIRQILEPVIKEIDGADSKN